MNGPSVPPGWRLPEGVNAALWEYTHNLRLAEEEDEFFRGHPLFEADARALDARFVEPGPLVDLGSGTGRHALRFARRGFPVVAVELSHAMLQAIGAKAGGLPLLGVEANLCRLGCFPDATFRYALSMFSTLGMIRGATARSRRWPRRSGSSGRAAAWRCTRITSGSTCATARGDGGCSARG